MCLSVFYCGVFIYDVDGVHAFFPSFEFELYEIAFMQVLRCIAGMEEVFFGGVNVFYESEAFCGVVVFHSSIVYGWFVVFFLFWDRDDDVFRVYVFFCLR